MYHKNIGDVKYWRFPNFIDNIFKAFFGNILADSYHQTRGSNTMPEVRGYPHQAPSNNLSAQGLNSANGQVPENENNQTHLRSRISRQVIGSDINTDSIIPNPMNPAPESNIPDQQAVEEQISQLQSMFPYSSRDRIVLALQSANYDPNIAASNLLEFP
ncbi:hypothetical protein BB560_001850 [Smittium megazygosporum]|uniref:CUE domain-containing protein n=1 Tax=Smittium megazygosporum TaxID=133381 RepID=A0A2T9ZGD6_9FUNG|nr:hypothetical protein BB560_001850 [Smittium megazygosporum]